MQPSVSEANSETDSMGRNRPDSIQVDGAEIRRLRLARGRSQIKASELGGVARNHWSAIETGARGPGVRPDTAFRIARGLAPAGATEAEIEALIPRFATVPERSPASL